MLSDFGSSDAHGDTDVSLLESWGVIGTISSDCNSCATVLDKTVNEHEFVVWKGSGQYFKLFGDVLEGTDILDYSLRYSFFVNGDFSADLVSEFFTSHADVALFIVTKVLLVDNVSLL